MPPPANNHEKLIEKRCEQCSSLLAKAKFVGVIEVMCKCGFRNTFESNNDIRTEGTKEEIRTELMKYGMSFKRSSALIERVGLCFVGR